MKPGIFSALAVFVIKKSLLGIIADAGVKTAAFTKKKINIPHKLKVSLGSARDCAHYVRLLRGLEQIRTYFVNQTTPLFIPDLI